MTGFWERGLGRYREGADRRARIRSAYAAARNQRGLPTQELREVVRSELAARGISDYTEPQLDAVAAALKSSPVKVAVAQAAAAGRLGAEVVRAAKAGHSPRWTESPHDAVAYEWPDDVASLFAQVDVAVGARELVERLIAQCPNLPTPPELNAGSSVLLNPWLDPTDLPTSSRALPVRIGSEVLGTVSGRPVEIVRVMLEETDGRLSIEGYIIGNNSHSAIVQIELPDLGAAEQP
jgi:hypothetical protein